MASEKLNLSATFFLLYSLVSLIGFIHSEDGPHLEILPLQAHQRKPIGKPLMLTCRPVVPDGGLLTDLQWRNSKNITIAPKPSGKVQPQMYTEILPGDSLALFIPSLTKEMRGKYYCSASYANSHLLETSVTIETYVPITWKNAPEKQNPILGTDYTVKCEVTADPSPTIDWLRNGDQIKSGSKFVVHAEGLTIRNVQESDDGTYTCRAAVIVTGELVERNIQVEAFIKPEIKTLPEGLEAVEGHEFSTLCNATGKPLPTITWIKSQTNQNVSTLDRFVVNPLTGALTITEVKQEDYGTYFCQAENDVGVDKKATKLNVLVRPKIKELYNVSEVVGREVVLTCRAEGRPAPEITFRRWGSKSEFVPDRQPNDDRIFLEQYADNEKGEASGALRITKLMRSDDGLYECVARNKGDTAYQVGHITVQFPPDFTYMKTLPPVYSWEQRVANLSCLAESIPNATIEWRWNGRLIDDTDKNLIIEGKGPTSVLKVTPVDRMYYSTYKCKAENIHGKAEIDIQLKEATIPDLVQSARAKEVTATKVTFDIIGPVMERGFPLTAITVRYKEENDLEWPRGQTRDWSPDSPYVVEGLRPQTSYYFQFAARNQVGLGQWGPIVKQSTPKRSAPERPKPLHAQENEGEDEAIVMSPYSDHFELRWSTPADNGEPIDFYQIKYCPGHKVKGEWHELGQNCITKEVVARNSFELSNLNPSTYYRIELWAHNEIGFSAPASIMMKTARDNPYNIGSTIQNSWSKCGLLLIVAILTTIIPTAAFTLDNTISPEESTNINKNNFVVLSNNTSCCCNPNNISQMGYGSKEPPINISIPFRIN